MLAVARACCGTPAAGVGHPASGCLGREGGCMRVTDGADVQVDLCGMYMGSEVCEHEGVMSPCRRRSFPALWLLGWAFVCACGGGRAFCVF